LLYGRSQLSEAVPVEVLQFAARDRRFPNYSTLDQFLSDGEHVHLTMLGAHLAERMVQLYEGGSSIDPCV
jgi:predicted SpoU family rRNA methylase